MAMSLTIHDTRWASPQTHILKTFLVFTFIKTVVFILFLILSITEISLNLKWVHNSSDSDSYQHYAGIVFLRWAGIVAIPEFLHTIAQLVCLYQVPSRFHPVFALSGSCVFFCLWTISCWLNILLAISTEISFDNSDTWLTLCYTESAFQALIALSYIGMIIVAALGVHRWRKAKAAQGVKLHDVEVDAEA